MRSRPRRVPTLAAWLSALAVAVLCAPASAQSRPVPPQASAGPAAAAFVPPPDYVIGPEDILQVVFWRDKELSAEVVVRSDGKITLPLLNEVPAAGLTPEQLRERVLEEARRYVEEPTATIIVRQMNSRKVFITGQVHKPGHYPLLSPMTVMQLIATAGGLTEYAKGEKIVILRFERGREGGYRFNYNQVLRRRNLRQNIALKPGDTVVVP